MSAAIADHGGGKGWRRGMAISQTGEIATPSHRRSAGQFESDVGAARRAN